MLSPDEKKLLKRIDHKLTALLNKEPEKKVGTWVTAKFIINITGWSKNDMALARKNKWIEKRETETGGYEYLLESLNEKFIKKAS